MPYPEVQWILRRGKLNKRKKLELNLKNYDLLELTESESKEKNGGWLILLAIAIEGAAALIEFASIALAADMVTNPKRYKAAYRKGATGK